MILLMFWKMFLLICRRLFRRKAVLKTVKGEHMFRIENLMWILEEPFMIFQVAEGGYHFYISYLHIILTYHTYISYLHIILTYYTYTSYYLYHTYTSYLYIISILSYLYIILLTINICLLILPVINCYQLLTYKQAFVIILINIIYYFNLKTF